MIFCCTVHYKLVDKQKKKYIKTDVNQILSPELFIGVESATSFTFRFRRCPLSVIGDSSKCSFTLHPIRQTTPRFSSTFGWFGTFHLRDSTLLILDQRRRLTLSLVENLIKGFRLLEARIRLVDVVEVRGEDGSEARVISVKLFWHVKKIG